MLLLLRRVHLSSPPSPPPRALLAKPLLLLRPPKTLPSTARRLAAMAASAGATMMTREAFRSAVTNTLERRLFFVPSFKIYGGVAGFYDYGPPGCAVKANVLAFWRQKLVITPSKKELGLAFKGNQKMVLEALEAMSETEALDMKAALESKGEVEFKVCTLGKDVTIKKNTVSINIEKKKEHQRKFTPSVVEPSFGIGRIIYCLFEHLVILSVSATRGPMNSVSPWQSRLTPQQV